MKSDALIQLKAMRLLSQAAITRPSVDVRKVAAILKAEIREQGSDDDISGALYRLSHGAVIGVNASQRPQRRRFTIAHELGHLLLHDLPVFVDREYSEPNSTSPRPRFLRNRLSAMATDPYEVEANKFAACLLMPRAFLQRDLKAESAPLKGTRVDELAKLYDVSVQAMMFRLSNLGVPLDVA